MRLIRKQNLTTEASEQTGKNNSCHDIKVQHLFQNSSAILHNNSNAHTGTPKNGYDSHCSYKKDTISSKMKKRLASMSKDRNPESISMMYAKHRSPLQIDEGEIDMHIDKGPLTYRIMPEFSATQRESDLNRDL